MTVAEPTTERPIRETRARVLRDEDHQHAVVCVRRVGMFRRKGLYLWCDRCSCYHLLTWSEWWKSLLWFGGLS